MNNVMNTVVSFIGSISNFEFIQYMATYKEYFKTRFVDLLSKFKK